MAQARPEDIEYVSRLKFSSQFNCTPEHHSKEDVEGDNYFQFLSALDPKTASGRIIYEAVSDPVSSQPGRQPSPFLRRSGIFRRLDSASAREQN